MKKETLRVNNTVNKFFFSRSHIGIKMNSLLYFYTSNAVKFYNFFFFKAFTQHFIYNRIFFKGGEREWKGRSMKKHEE